MSSLELTLLYLLAAVLGVVVCRSFKLPPILGYLAVGVLIGPNALALAENSKAVSHLGEFGVVFLMFVIGLEFNLPRLRAMRRHVFGLGLAQVVLTIAVGAAASMLLAWALPAYWGMRWQTAVALSSALAMSSTAIVVKLMAERLELETQHGQRVMGILLFQDLAVVPLLVLIPALGASDTDLMRALALAALKATIIITFLLVGGQKIMRWWLTLVARRRSEELFILNILLVTLGLAWVTELAGLSLALGAFIAGMLISETEFKQQVESEIRPFHDVLLGLFFISIGMLLDWRIVAERWPIVLALATLPVLFKFALITALARWMGSSSGISLRTGLYLAQAGEFGFVLLTLAQGHQLVPPALLNPILASMVLSMLATPLIIQWSNAIVLRLSSNEWLQQSLQMTQIARKSIKVNKHVLICGYGRCGQNLARLLEAENLSYLALDLDPDRVRQAAAAGDAVEYGDSTKLQALMAAGLVRASAVVVTYLDEGAAKKVLHHVRSHAPQVPVVVRTQDDHALEELQRQGATEVVPEAIEGSLMLATHTMALVGVPMRRVIRVVQEQRDGRYQLLRGYFHGDDDNESDTGQERLATLSLPAGAHAIGQTAQALGLAECGVRLISLRRKRGQRPAEPALAPLAEGDTLVLSGAAEGLAVAERRLLSGT
jgi:monovalent cation:H+ antiporter-2, CPA2 family